MKKPAPLTKGSRLRVVAPASAPDSARLQAGLRHLRAMGFEVELSELVRNLRRRGYLSGRDDERARVLIEAFEDTDVDGIICSNGGYGSQRILPLLDYDAIAQNPKVFIGFSDITALHLAIERRASLVTFHGPMACTDHGEGLDRAWTRDHLERAVTSSKPLGPIENPDDGAMVRIVRHGIASGLLTGGNLSLVAASLGTPWEIDTRDRVLFLEEWREPPFTVDTMLMQLKLSGKLGQAAAIVFGEFPHCDTMDQGPTLSVAEVVQDVTQDLDIPVLFGLAAGHGKDTLTLPMGIRATVDADKCIMTIDEAATSG